MDPATKPESKPDPNPSKKYGGKQKKRKDHSATPSETSSKHCGRKAHEKLVQGGRKTLLDVINAAFVQSGRVTYLHRLIYVGQHSVIQDPREGSEDLHSIFQTSVNLVNQNYCSESLSGCFIYYPNYFIHIVEGAEDSIGLHVKIIVEKIKQYEDKFGVVKIILQCHHIRKRYFGAWFSMFVVPNSLLEKIQGDAEDVIMEQLQNFYRKILIIASYLDSDEGRAQNHLNQETLDSFPEVQLLEFLMKIDCLETLEEFLKTYAHFPHLEIYQDYCWPPIMEFVPYNLYLEIPEISKLEIPSYRPIEEVEVLQRMKGFRISGNEDKKSQQTGIDNLLKDATEGDKENAKETDQQIDKNARQQEDTPIQPADASKVDSEKADVQPTN